MIRFMTNNICKSVLTAMMLLAAITSADARQLTPDAALARFKGSKGTHIAKTATKQPKLIGTQKANGLSTMYLFNQPDNGGFVILSADDVAPAVLAYSYSGSIDINDLPPAMEEWMEEFSQIISTASKQSKTLKATSNSKWKDIAPMLTTTWSQGSNAYNLYCPLINENDDTQHRVVGCAATAMGQIMNFWEWPTQGKGSYSYTTSTDKLSIEADFNVTYDWNNMADAYLYYKMEKDAEGNDVLYLYKKSGITPEQRQAVSLLLFHAGAAINMNYKTSSSSAVSSRYVKNDLNGNINPMVDYFSYDEGIRFVERKNYANDEDWLTLLYDELSAGRPVYYTGHTTEDEGHAFVCDGYEYTDNDFFHFNWGWNGRADGYFLVTGSDPLHPTWQGTGGAQSGYGFSQNHTMIIGIQPYMPEIKYGNAYEAAQDKLCKSLQYKWYAYQNKWNSWFVPFEITTTQLASNGMEAAYINGVHQYDDNSDGTIDRTTVELVKIADGTLYPGHPYFVKPSTGGIITVEINDPVTLKSASETDNVHTETSYAAFDFIGTYSLISSEIAAGNFYIMSDAGGLSITTDGINAMDWYMKITPKKPQYGSSPMLAKVEDIDISIIGEENQTTGIRTLYNEPIYGGKLNGTFNMNGQRLNAPQTGINIINGKKYIIK